MTAWNVELQKKTEMITKEAARGPLKLGMIKNRSPFTEIKLGLR